MYYTFKTLIALFCLSIMLSACKKDERTSEEWGQLAAAKFQEMKTLGENIPCDQQSNVSIQEISLGCAWRYFPVLASDLEKFNRLRSEYQRLLDAQAKARAREGVVYDIMPCWAAPWAFEQPVRLQCKNNKVELITSENIEIEEAKPLAENTYKDITGLLNAQTCTSASGWGYTALLRNSKREVQFIPYMLTADNTELQKKVSLYNRLMIRIIDAEGSKETMMNIPTVKGITCINGKPTVQLADQM